MDEWSEAIRVWNSTSVYMWTISNIMGEIVTSGQVGTNYPSIREITVYPSVCISWNSPMYDICRASSRRAWLATSGCCRSIKNNKGHSWALTHPIDTRCAYHQQRKIPCRRNCFARVDALHHCRQRHLSGRFLCTWRQNQMSHCISPSNHGFTISSRLVGDLFQTNTLLLWPIVTIHLNGYIGYALASGLQCDGWHCKNLSSHSFYLCAKCNSLFTNYTHHCKSADLCGYWQSIPHSICLLSYYW